MRQRRRGRPADYQGGSHSPAAPRDNSLLGDILCLASQCSVAVYFVFFKD